MKNNSTTTFGPIETEIIARLTYENTIFINAKTLDNMFGLNPIERAKTVLRLKRKNILFPVKRGVYFFSPLESSSNGRSTIEMLVPQLYFPKKNYYIGYSMMYNFYGFTDQIFQTMYILNTSFSKRKIIDKIEYNFIKTNANRMYGLKTIKIKDIDVIISDKERTLVDLIYFNKPVGGINNAENILKDCINNEKCNIKKIINYASKFPIIKTRKQIGLFLDNLNIKNSMLYPLIKSVKNTSLISFSGSRKGKINNKWKVIINDS